ncbi:MAG: hypothetical protein H7A35_08110 [Planctomycetales bacterium]|nr:hypothetical protein [bacterium]UNM06850.1 MAG: hypothetical protein H7A35_08110 [Planctomycetales bacterium]
MRLLQKRVAMLFVAIWLLGSLALVPLKLSAPRDPGQHVRYMLIEGASAPPPNTGGFICSLPATRVRYGFCQGPEEQYFTISNGLLVAFRGQDELWRQAVEADSHFPRFDCAAGPVLVLGQSSGEASCQLSGFDLSGRAIWQRSISFSEGSTIQSTEAGPDDGVFICTTEPRMLYIDAAGNVHGADVELDPEYSFPLSGIGIVTRSGSGIRLYSPKMRAQASWQCPTGNEPVLSVSNGCLLVTDRHGSFWILDSALQELARFSTDTPASGRMCLSAAGERFAVHLENAADPAHSSLLLVDSAAGVLWRKDEMDYDKYGGCQNEPFEWDYFNVPINSIFSLKLTDFLVSDSSGERHLLATDSKLVGLDSELNVLWETANPLGSSALDNDYYFPYEGQLLLSHERELLAMDWDGNVLWQSRLETGQSPQYHGGYGYWRSDAGTLQACTAEGLLEPIPVPRGGQVYAQSSSGRLFVHVLEPIDNVTPLLFSVPGKSASHYIQYCCRHSLLDAHGTLLSRQRIAVSELPNISSGWGDNFLKVESRQQQPAWFRQYTMLSLLGFRNHASGPALPYGPLTMIAKLAAD